jgi:hypothetical protein
MKKDQTQNPPRKLHKPRRESGDLRPEQVVTYVDDAPCDTSTDPTDTLGGGPG